MNDEVKEILIDLIDYWNTMGTESDPGIEAFHSVVQRASKALERHANPTKQVTRDVDPFKAYDEFPDDVLKFEEDW